MSLGVEKKTRKLPYMYRAKVEDNADPLKLGRIQARIYPMFADEAYMPTKYLPWAVPAMGLFVGAGEGFGSFTIPDIGTMIFVFFEAGDPYQPVYFASATDRLKGIPASSATDYPFTRVARTQNGIQVKIDDKAGSEDFRVDHPKGSYVEFFPDGRVTVHTTEVAATLTMETDKSLIVINAKDNSAIFQSKKNTGVVATEGEVTIASYKSNVNITAASQVNIIAPSVKVSEKLTVGNGANGEFTTANGALVSVTAGIITEIKES